MTPLVLWARRGSCRYAVLVIFGILLFGLFGRGNWHHEWLLGFRNVAATIMLISPLVAAAAAFDASRSWGPLVDDVGRQTQRLYPFIAAAFAVNVILPFLAFCAAWMVSAIVLWRGRAIGHPDPWLPFEVLAGLSACAAVGTAIGLRFRSVGAAPLAAILTYLITLLGGAYNLLPLLSAVGAVSSLLGLERSPKMALVAILLNVSAAIAAAALSVPQGRGGLKRRSVTVAAVVSFLFMVGVTDRAARETQEYVPASSQMICRGHTTQVCGPIAADEYLSDVATAVERGTTKLSNSGLPMTPRYTLATPGVLPDPSSGASIVELPPDRFYGRELAAVSDVLSRPRLCPQLLEPGPETTDILDAEEEVAAWIRQVLASSGDQSAPQAVRGAFNTVATCGKRA